MCGIAGLIAVPGFATRDQLGSLAEAMTQRLVHRGPDSGAAWTHDRVSVAFGHRRLAIIDLSDDGAQPMHRGALTITYNGEIYNYLELRTLLEAEGVQFASHSDTEVLLAAIERWGIDGALQRAVGMFAFGLWDDRNATLTLARDRFGEKPLYFAHCTGRLAFASELKAFRELPDFRPALNREAIDAFLRRGYVPGSSSVFDGVRQVVPGTAMQFRIGQIIESTDTITYWDVDREIDAARTSPFSGSAAEAADELERLLTGVVRAQTVADVPLGSFLSGGIDSSTITALLQKVSVKPVQTFTIGSNSSSSEANEAAAVARHLGTEHTELIAGSKEALDVVPMLPTMYDEPFADSSQIPTFLVARLARQHVTVALSGDGGDEVFGGYNRHIAAGSSWPRLERFPVSVRRAVGRSVLGVRPARWDALERPLGRMGLSTVKGGLGNRIHKSAGVLGARTTAELHETLTTHWPASLSLVDGVQPSRFIETSSSTGWSPRLGSAERMMRLDTKSYLVDDILTKVDRAAMATSLETRVPFLDPSVFRFAWSLPIGMRVGANCGKLVVRDVLARHVPRPLWDRPKTGFAIPLGDWLRGPLRPWAEAHLTTSRLLASGLAAEPIRETWQAHCAGRRNSEHALWNVMMLLAWEDAQAQ